MKNLILFGESPGRRRALIEGASPDRLRDLLLQAPTDADRAAIEDRLDRWVPRLRRAPMRRSERFVAARREDEARAEARRGRVAVKRGRLRTPNNNPSPFYLNRHARRRAAALARRAS